MTDERLQDIFDSCANDDPDVHLIYGRAVALAATLAEREKRQPLTQLTVSELAGAIKVVYEQAIKPKEPV